MVLSIPEGKSIVLFDGVCNVCNTFVNFVIDRDSEGKIMFASLQSDKGQQLLKERKIENNLDSMVLIQDGVAYQRSSAAIRTLAMLDFFLWRALLILLVLPPLIRDLGYNLFARYRYTLFGTSDESCRRLTPQLKKRFLQFQPDSIPSAKDS